MEPFATQERTELLVLELRRFHHHAETFFRRPILGPPGTRFRQRPLTLALRHGVEATVSLLQPTRQRRSVNAALTSEVIRATGVRTHHPLDQFGFERGTILLHRKSRSPPVPLTSQMGPVLTSIMG